MSRLRFALGFLGLGWSFYPTRPRSKEPFSEILPLITNEKGKRVSAWSPFQRELPSVREVEDWFLIAPSANMALVTGAVSNLCIVDCDTEEAVSGFCDLCGVEVAADFQTPMVRTSRGMHFYFERPAAPDVRASKKVIETAFEIPDLELKADLNCCTAPPSVHASGHQYRFEMSPHRYPLQPLPAPLAELATRTRQEIAVPSQPFSMNEVSSNYGRVALRGALDKLAATRAHRNDELNNQALAMGRLVASGVLDEHTVKAALYEVAAQIGLEPREIRTTIQSGFNRGLIEPRVIRDRPNWQPERRRPQTLAQMRGAFA